MCVCVCVSVGRVCECVCVCVCVWVEFKSRRFVCECRWEENAQVAHGFGLDRPSAVLRLCFRRQTHPHWRFLRVTSSTNFRSLTEGWLEVQLLVCRGRREVERAHLFLGGSNAGGPWLKLAQPYWTSCLTGSHRSTCRWAQACSAGVLCP